MVAEQNIDIDHKCDILLSAVRGGTIMGIARDLWKILSEDLEVPSAFLVKWHLKTFPVEEVYALFAAGKIQAEGVYARLRPRQVSDFIALHEEVRRALAEEKGFPPSLATCLAEMLTENPRRLAFVVSQVDALIERDLEKNIFRERGTKNIVRRE
jgi:hypothetical protein